MKVVRRFLANALVGGVLVVLPIYLAVLVLLKGAQSAATLIRPFTKLLPAWLPAENVLSLVLVLTVCFLIGVAVRTRRGQSAPRADGEVAFRETAGIRAVSKSHAATRPGRAKRTSGSRHS